MTSYEQILQHFTKVSSELETKLKQLNIEQLAISDYSKKYWKDNIRKLNYVMKCNSFVLANAVYKSGKSIKEITLVDNGGGTGSISLLAKIAGIKKVIYNDIYDVSCVDAKVVGKALLIEADEYVCADSDELVIYFKNNSISCDCVVSRNVIEHIYNLDVYFKHLSQFTNGPMVFCLATTANIKNPLVNIYTRRIQRMAEWQGSKGKWQKERDSRKSFYEIRKEIIREQFSNLDENKLDHYSKASRGLFKMDVIELVKSSEEKNILPKMPYDATNTCDPLTGNRTENLISANEYKRLATSAGFDFELKAGFYNENYAQKFLNVATPILNFLIRKISFLSIFLAPFILIVGVKKRV